MNIFETERDALLAIRSWTRENWDKLPEHLQALIEELEAPEASPVRLMTDLAEALYAMQGTRGVSNKATRHLVAGLAELADLRGWSRLREGRGLRIANAMRRENGDEPLAGRPWPAPGTDPDPDPRFKEA